MQTWPVMLIIPVVALVLLMAVLHDHPGRSWRRTRTRASSSRFRRRRPTPTSTRRRSTPPQVEQVFARLPGDANVFQLFGAISAAPPRRRQHRPSAAWCSSPGASGSGARSSCCRWSTPSSPRIAGFNDRGVPAPAAARRGRRRAGAVRRPLDRHARTHGPGGRRAGRKRAHAERPVLLRRQRPQIRPAAGRRGHRPQQGRRARRQHAAGGHRRRLAARAAATSTTSTSRATATRSSRRSSASGRLNPEQLGNYYVSTGNGGAGAALHLRLAAATGCSRRRSTTSSSSTPPRSRSCPGRRVAGPGARLSARARPRQILPAGLQRGLRRPVAPVRPGGQLAPHRVRLRRHHHLPRAGGAVRELPRPVDHPAGQRADDAGRRPGVPLPRVVHRSTSTPRSASSPSSA